MPSITQATARKLAVSKQHLSGDSPATMLETIRALGCLQLDPISAVTRSHEIVLWSRLGDYDLAELERLRFEEVALFEYWAHAASMVLTEDYPLYKPYIEAHGTGDKEWMVKLRAWVEEHESLRQHILGRLRDEGPLPSRAFESQGPRGVGSVGWTSGRDITHMIDYLWNSGQVMVAGREGMQRVWGLTENILPEWTPMETLTLEAITARAAQRAIKALGVATAPQIRRHFTRSRYPGLNKVLKILVKEGRILPVEWADAPPWKGETYIHVDDLPLVESIADGAFTPKTTLLSPFDNLICDRQRTEQLWDFSYRIEIYVPKDKRQYGYYVLPILHGDRLVGRIDPKYDRKTGTFHVYNIYWEPDAPADVPLEATIHQLGTWLGADAIDIVEGAG